MGQAKAEKKGRKGHVDSSVEGEYREAGEFVANGKSCHDKNNARIFLSSMPQEFETLVEK
jgi:hypothetical protein